MAGRTGGRGHLMVTKLAVQHTHARLVSAGRPQLHSLEPHSTAPLKPHLTGSTCGSSTPSTRAALLRTKDTTSSTSCAELRMSVCVCWCKQKEQRGGSGCHSES
jgi:hypothetical protein